MKLMGDKAVAFASKPKTSIWAALAYCDDEGVANDAARALLNVWVGDDPDAEVAAFTDDDIRKDGSAFFDALEARSLLGGKRAVRIRATGDKAAAILAEALAAADAKPDRFDAKLIVTAGALAKKSKLRGTFEDSQTAMALQLFADEIGDVSTLIKATLKQSDIEIADDAVSALAAHLPGHRRIIHAEIEKLSLYALGLGRPVSVADIQNICIGSIDATATAYVDAVFDRDLPGALDALNKMTISGTSSISIIRTLQRETQRLLQVSALGPSASPQAGMKLRPPVFRSQWDTLSRRARAWPDAALARILERIYDLEHQAKRTGPIAEAALQYFTVQVARPLRGSKKD